MANESFVVHAAGSGACTPCGCVHARRGVYAPRRDVPGHFIDSIHFHNAITPHPEHAVSDTRGDSLQAAITSMVKRYPGVDKDTVNVSTRTQPAP